MSETRIPQNEIDPPEPEDGEVIGRLLRLAGPRPGAPREMEERVKGVVHERWRESVSARRRRRALFWSAGSLAAAAATVVAVGVAGRRSGQAPPQAGDPAGTVLLATGLLRGPEGTALTPGSDVDRGAALETAADSRAAIRLSGGASIRLDRATRVTLEGDSLLDLERGAVYVDSGGAAVEGVVAIRTGLGMVRDVGTQFEVRVQDRGLKVRVRDGIVHVDRRGDVREVASGIQLTLDEIGEARFEPVARHGPDWEWVLDVAPRFELEGRTLGAFLAWVSSETGLRVTFSAELAGRDVTGIVLHGSVAGLRPDQAPEAVLPTCGLSHRVDGDTLVVGPPGPEGAGR